MHLAANESLIPAPSIEYYQLSPILVVFGVAILGVVVEAFLPRSQRLHAQVFICLAGLATAFVLVCTLTDKAHQNARAVPVGSSRVDLQACKLEYSIVSPK